MSREPEPQASEPHGPPQLGEPGEHPLSVLLFSWMRTKLFLRLLMGALAGAGVLLIAVEAVGRVEHPTRVSGLEDLPGFFGIFGLLAFSFAVLSGWPLGRLLRRPEDYYDTSSGEAGRDD
ncbi:MAG TPA: hypothetical protein VFV70_16275 [Hyphomonadaceae bacterium]|nr:hypothetical protein [Hyphomonadaceae bacterium]